MGKKVISDEQVRQLRTRRVINEEYLNDLAQEFGISPSQALRIVRGEYRAKAGGPLQGDTLHLKPRRDMSGANNPNYDHGLSIEDRRLIKQLVKDGASHRAVAGVMFCSPSTVQKIVADPEILPHNPVLHDQTVTLGSCMQTYYIEGPVNGKAEYIRDHGGVLLERAPSRLAPIGAYVCVVLNALFDAAAVILTDEDLKHFSDPDDHREKHWLHIGDPAVVAQLLGWTG